MITKMKKIRVLTHIIVSLVAVSTLLISMTYHGDSKASTIVARSAPEFTQTTQDAWIGSVPITMSSLRGKVVLLDFWTFECWNCYRSFPWLNSLEDRFKNSDFQVIGIHSPEFAREKKRSAIVEKIKEFGLKHPSMMDNDFAFWHRMNNKYWPTFYLIDKRGYIRHVFIGETHEGDRQAIKVETAIKNLLAEAS